MRPHCLPFGVSTCDFHLLLWLSAQQDIPERVVALLNINRPRKQSELGVPLAKSCPRFLLKINQTALSLDPETSTCAAKKPRIAYSGVPLAPLQSLMIPAPPLQLLLPTPPLHTDSRRTSIKVYITAEK